MRRNNLLDSAAQRSWTAHFDGPSPPRPPWDSPTRRTEVESAPEARVGLRRGPTLAGLRRHPESLPAAHAPCTHPNTSLPSPSACLLNPCTAVSYERPRQESNLRPTA